MYKKLVWFGMPGLHYDDLSGVMQEVRMAVANQVTTAIN